MIKRHSIAIRFLNLLLLLVVAAPRYACADLDQPGAIGRELQQQEQRERALREQRSPPMSDVRRRPSQGGAPERLPRETPCFQVQRVELQGDVKWLQRLLRPLARHGEGQCLGVEGIRLLMRWMQNRLVEEGLVTTRVLAPTQDLERGVLVLRILAGRVGRLQPREGGGIDLAAMLPSRPGDLLDLRDLEQGLENLRRLPGVEADLQLVPGQRPGESDLQVGWRQQKKWRVALALDDAGSEQTGKRQASVTLFLDNPLGRGDLFYISRGRDLLNPGARGSDSYQLHYSIPRGYWMLGLNASRYGYHQTISGGVVDYRYRGAGHSLDLEISRVFQRGASSRTSVGFKLGRRASSNFIDDIEIALQRRRSAYWQLATGHRRFLGRAILELELSYRGGLKGLGAEPAPEERAGGASAREGFWQARLDLQLPFVIRRQRFHYHAHLEAQIARGALTPPDRFSIGSRWTVRGFDGQSTLAADSGWYLRNELAWQLPGQPERLYAGLDLGRVSGGGSDLLPGRDLVGTVLGFRGNRGRLEYDLFVGLPLEKPLGMESDNGTFGFSLNWQW